MKARWVEKGKGEKCLHPVKGFGSLGPLTDNLPMRAAAMNKLEEKDIVELVLHAEKIAKIKGTDNKFDGNGTSVKGMKRILSFFATHCLEQAKELVEKARKSKNKTDCKILLDEAHIWLRTASVLHRMERSVF